MNHRRWLKKEVSTWIEEKIIDKETGDTILSRYTKEYRQRHGEAFGFLAFVCVLLGLGFILSGYWTSITQDQRFWASILLPIVSAVMMICVVFFDKKVPIEEDKTQKENDGESVNNLNKVDDNSEELLPKKKKFRNFIREEIKEAIYIFHALSLVGASFLIMDSFKLNDDYYFIYAMGATFLLLLSYVLDSVGTGVVSIVSVAVSVALSQNNTWIELLSWLYLILYLPFMAKTLLKKRYKATIAFAWIWTLCVLFMIFKSVEVLFWQMMFMSLAASLTWMVGGILHKFSYVSQSLKIFGAISVFAVLLQSGFGNVWQNISGNWILWTLYVLFLCIDAFLVFQMMIYKEGVAFLGGLTPFFMFISAICAMFVANGSLSVLVVSVYSILLAFVLMWKGWKSGNIVKRWIGFCIILMIATVRILDSSFSMLNRGIFFIIAGIVATLICAFFVKFATVKPSKKRVKRRVKRKNENALIDQNKEISQEVRHE